MYNKKDDNICLSLLVLLSSVCFSWSFPHIQPFFFLCNINGLSKDVGIEKGEISLSVSIKGNPEYYQPGEIYDITIQSSNSFDNFLLTGLYSLSEEVRKRFPFMSLSSRLPVQGESFMCSTIFSHSNNTPEYKLQFKWIAPPKDTGCVNFRATAALSNILLFKDTTVLQLCEKGDPSDLMRPKLISIHTKDFILRDTFDDSSRFDSSLWLKSEGGAINAECGTVLHDKSAVFCDQGLRKLVTVPLNISTAAVIQFSISSGSCTNVGAVDSDIIFYYGTNACSNWIEMERIPAPNSSKTITHLVRIPVEARKNDVCLSWEQRPILAVQPDYLKKKAQSVLKELTLPHVNCWAMDNVLIPNLAHIPDKIEEGFEPISTDDWLFFPGAKLGHKCRSQGDAMYFDSSQQHNYVMSQDVNLLELSPDDENLIFEENFDRDFKSNWMLEGAHIGEFCSELDRGYSLVFQGEGKRRACTPYTDMITADNIRFYLSFGPEKCSGNKTNKAEVILYQESLNSETILLSSFKPNSYRSTVLNSVIIKAENRRSVARICWEQKYYRNKNLDHWAIDKVQILPHMHSNYVNEKDKYIQFSLNMMCGFNITHNKVDLEFSTDHGLTWNLLHDQCLPAACGGQFFSLHSSYETSDFDLWKRFTLPIPNGAMMPYVRFRWKKSTNNVAANWALDNVFIGSCPRGCNNHGTCHKNSCECDFGFSGESCDTSVVPNPSLLLEMFVSPSVIQSSSQLDIKGAELNYKCGVLSTGKSLVFNKDGRRELVTTDMNTTTIRFLQFHIRVGSNSYISECRPPDRTTESVFLEYSCNGGITWTLLKMFSSEIYKSPQMDSVELPKNAKRDACRFRWIQPEHSGSRQDVWALDDIILNDLLFHTLDIETKDLDREFYELTASQGKLIDTYCDMPKPIGFIDEPKIGEKRYIMTSAMKIGPSYMIQFNISMGCGYPYVSGLDNKVRLEYSNDHGLTWSLVEKACLPPERCEEYSAGTVYEYFEYPTWNRITILLPPDTWSRSTKFRLIQNEWSPTDTWAVDRIYIGQQCPHMCRGHGICDKGICRCDSGFRGVSCEPSSIAKNGIQADFGSTYTPENDFKIKGGDTVSGYKGCGTILSGESMYFYKDGIRVLTTDDLYTLDDDYIQFYIQIGGNGKDCNGADNPKEGVLLQYSTNAGISWKTLEELVYNEYREPKFVHSRLPKDAKSDSTRFRWWQPMHSGKGTDQWAVDGIYIGFYEKLDHLQDSFNRLSDLYTLGPWLTVTDGVNGMFCESNTSALILANQENDKLVITKDMNLKEGDTIQFKINVDCNKKFQWDHPVLFQYSHDNGNSWQLVSNPCYDEDECNGELTEGTIFYSGTYGDWRLVMIPVTEEIASRPVLFRWWQRGGTSHSFSLDDVYIGASCPERCNRRGVCESKQCKCEEPFKGKSCYKVEENPLGMIDRFDNRNEPNELWRRTTGSMLGTMCGVIDNENALFFPADGTREAVTLPLDTTHLRLVQFQLSIGDVNGNKICKKPKNRNEAVILDYSTDNEVTWTMLKVIEPKMYNSSNEVVSVELPASAKTNRTIFRWWQPLGYGVLSRAVWGIDSVLVGVNDTSAMGFQDDFNGQNPNPNSWYITQSGVPRISCASTGHALEFSRNSEKRYAETWDYHITPSTFLQFDISMGCGTLYNTLYSVALEYSIDTGKTWHSVIDECAPPKFICNGYHLSSQYVSEQHINWTRITIYLPAASISPNTRFRWYQHTQSPRGDIWALDNVYLGSGCPWLCSGQGYCDHGRCVCDKGFQPPNCVPEKPLPMNLRDDFSLDSLDRNKWQELYGGEVSDICGHLVSGNALVFAKDLLRLVVTENMDTTMINNIEFYFKYACKGESLAWPRRHSVLLQYSINGGITWHLLQEIHYKNDSNTRFFSVFLPPLAKANATKFRFWQPKHGGSMQSTWAIDNFFVGTMTLNPNMLHDRFGKSALNPDLWQFSNNGEIGPFCELNRREDTSSSGHSAMVFKRAKGEHSVVTRDLDIGPMSVVQFDINVGCGAAATHKYPVRLEYSVNGGKTWQLIVPNCATYALARCDDQTRPTAIYYSGTTKYWRRIIIPLDGLHACGAIRFRWTQGYIPYFDYAPEWAIDNVFIGMMCLSHCNGHGSCGSSMLCECDTGYNGDMCIPFQQYPTYMKEEFKEPVLAGSSSVRDFFQKPSSQLLSAQTALDEKKWFLWSHGRITKKECGLLIRGSSLYFGENGDRLLISKDLDLSRVSIVQFFLRLGCKDTPPSTGIPPVYVQYSNDGGITWHTFEQFDFSSESNKPEYIVLHLPEKARTNSTQLKWWQPSTDGTFSEDWAIDQIYIGGDIDGTDMLLDEPTVPQDTNWLLYPGGEIKKACGSITDALSFEDEGNMRYAISRDVTTHSGTFIQFELAMGCEDTKLCYGMDLQFSLDMGVTWELFQKACTPSDIDCTSYHQSSRFMSDIYHGWNRITLPVPYYAKSKSTRFRWIQHAPFDKEQKWALRSLYIGKRCPQLCSGHGNCVGDFCRCDENWMGEDCHKPRNPLPTILKDSFIDADISAQNWLKIAGAKITITCTNLASGMAIHFIEGCSRLLISIDLDLRDSKFIQFYFMFGCYSSSLSRDQGVLVDYSADGGISWSHITELYYNQYKAPKFVNIKIPPGARKEGVRIRWWQPENDGKLQQDWALDDIVIGGNTVNPVNVTSNFTTDFVKHEWLTTNNLEIGEYCDLPESAVAKPVAGEGATLTTRDVKIQEDFILQFSINVGCGAPWNSSISPVHLKYSVNYGKNWYYVTPQCMTKDPQCNTEASVKTVYYSTFGWQRVIIPLTGHVTSSATRFQWFQEMPGLLSEDGKEWAIRDIYIGKACPDMCHGHGFCDNGQCRCDEGYMWATCHPKGYHYQATQLKDTFNEPNVNRSNWFLVQGASVYNSCMELVDGTALVFSGKGMRLAETWDLDLRDATFVLYTATIGGSDQNGGCATPRSRDQSVILQYSINGGIIWHTLYTLDYQYYQQPKTDYLKLPIHARTGSTRIRWWQPMPRRNFELFPSWALDNVYIGGSEINPSILWLNFTEGMHELWSNWEFSPRGQVSKEFCYKTEHSLTWNNDKREKSLTTNQLIVQDDTILQFKIAIGCDSKFNACIPNSPVHLEFRKNPSLDKWEHLLPVCLPDNNVLMSCRPHIHHKASKLYPDEFPTWTRYTLKLPDKAHSSFTQIRWVQKHLEGAVSPPWAIDEIYIGEKCPNMCNGRGDCRNGRCICEPGTVGKTCEPIQANLLKRLTDSFEASIITHYWESVKGGNIGIGCGALYPFAHGKSLYFNGCGLRHVVTQPMDLSTGGKIIFILQIGCHSQTDDCNINLTKNHFRGVLLQYSINKGIEWKLLARHEPSDYLKPKRVAYDIRRKVGVQFRWWQPEHGGKGHDQWAIDNVEILAVKNRADRPHLSR
ncbi:reelin [Argonauta hians]